MECLLLKVYKRIVPSSCVYSLAALSAPDNDMTNRIIILLLLLLAVSQFSKGTAQAAALLKTVNRADESAHLQLFFQFDQLPAFTTTIIGRRVDLELQDTILAETLATPATDSRMIKVLRDQQKSKAVLSFYFRYAPQKVTSESNKESATLRLDILPGDPLSTTHPELSAKPQKAAVADRTESEEINPLKTSRYAKKWLSFFTEYEPQVEITIPPKLHLPPFPLASAIQPIIGDEGWLSKQIQELAAENKWNQVYQFLHQQVLSQPDEKLKERLVLTYAEALIRAGEYKEPYILLQKISLQYPDTLMASLAQFLFIYQQAAKGDHVSAYYDLDTLFKKTEKEIPFTASFNVLLAELALMAGRPADAGKLLDRDDVVGSEQLKNLRALRQADLLYVKNEKAKALTAYLGLAAQSAIIDSDPMSLAHFCDVLYTDKRFKEAADKYRILSNQLNNAPRQDLALFRLAMSQLHLPEMERKARGDLQQIQSAFPRTEGGVRALLKQTDLDYVAKRMNTATAEAVYRDLALKAETIPLREEAAFKQALVNALGGEQQASVTQCMEMLRGFQSGKLRQETKALLIEQLPGVIKQLIHDKEYVKALVLAKQNKAFFTRGWIDASLLYSLAGAYSKLGLADQTAQTYQYLFEISTDTDKEKIYLPLIQTLFAAGRHVQVEEYADRYLLKYPKGKDAAAISLFKYQAMYESGQLAEVVKLLKADTRQRSPQLELLSARISFELQQWQDVISTLTKPELQKVLGQNSGTLLLAESYFQTGQNDLAAPVFRRLLELEKGNEQAQYRLAQIESKNNNTLQALNLFKELAEKGKDPLWTKLAREETAILQLQQKK